MACNVHVDDVDGTQKIRTPKIPDGLTISRSIRGPWLHQLAGPAFVHAPSPDRVLWPEVVATQRVRPGIETLAGAEPPAAWPERGLAADAQQPNAGELARAREQIPVEHDPLVRVQANAFERLVLLLERLVLLLVSAILRQMHRLAVNARNPPCVLPVARIHRGRRAAQALRVRRDKK